jgi:hypothetical protein
VIPAPLKEILHKRLPKERLALRTRRGKEAFYGFIPHLLRSPKLPGARYFADATGKTADEGRRTTTRRIGGKRSFQGILTSRGIIETDTDKFPQGPSEDYGNDEHTTVAAFLPWRGS